MHRSSIVRSAVAMLIMASAISVFAQQDTLPVLKPKKPGTATILVVCDLACDWTLDGEVMGSLAEGGSKKAPVSLGQHLLNAVTSDGVDRVEREVDIRTTAQTIIRFELKPVRDARLKVVPETSGHASQREGDKAAPASPQLGKEQELWQGIKDSSHVEDFQGYLDKYPDGTFAAVAKRRIEELQATRDWAAIKDSKDANDYQSYLKKYPDSTFAPVANREIAELAKEKRAKLENLAGSTWDIRMDWVSNGTPGSWTGQFVFVEDGSCTYTSLDRDEAACHWVKQGDIVSVTENSTQRRLARRWSLALSGDTISGQAQWIGWDGQQSGSMSTVKMTPR
jgi:hypothetical protein